MMLVPQQLPLTWWLPQTCQLGVLGSRCLRTHERPGGLYLWGTLGVWVLPGMPLIIGWVGQSTLSAK